MVLKEQIAQVAQEKLAESGLFLVEVKMLPARIVVYIDHPSTGVKVEDCISLSRHLQQHETLAEAFEKNELEVSSPGMDEPLKVLGQYKKRVGQRIEVITFDGMKREGVLQQVSESGIELEETRQVKKEGRKELVTTVHTLLFPQIKETRLHYSIDKLLK